MIKKIFASLPGPLPFRLAQAAVLFVLFLIALFFFYEWVGATFLDTGGSF